MKTRKRLDQWLANLGYCSRSEAKRFVKTGSVTHNGVPITDPATKLEAAGLQIDGEPLDHPEGIFIMLHKPLGYVCSHSADEGPTIYELLPERWRHRNPVITSIGRLDKDTTGLLLITDLSDRVHELTSPKKKVEKLYEVTVEQPLDPALIETFASGTLQLEDEPQPCLPATLKILNDHQAELTLTEGRYHQVRRMFAACHNTVLNLHRPQFGPWTLKDLPEAQWMECESIASY